MQTFDRSAFETFLADLGLGEASAGLYVRVITKMLTDADGDMQRLVDNFHAVSVRATRATARTAWRHYANFAGLDPNLLDGATPEKRDKGKSTVLLAPEVVVAVKTLLQTVWVGRNNAHKITIAELTALRWDCLAAHEMQGMIRVSNTAPFQALTNEMHDALRALAEWSTGVPNRAPVKHCPLIARAKGLPNMRITPAELQACLMTMPISATEQCAPDAFFTPRTGSPVLAPPAPAPEPSTEAPPARFALELPRVEKARAFEEPPPPPPVMTGPLPSIPELAAALKSAQRETLAELIERDRDPTLPQNVFRRDGSDEPDPEN